MNYEITECLLTPLQFGVPNDRLRYYLMARKRSDSCELNLPHEYLENAKIHLTWPLPKMLEKDHYQQDVNMFNIPSLSTYLETLNEEEIEKYLVPEKHILKSFNFRFGTKTLFLKSRIFFLLIVFKYM
jgi:tRNA (cytosine38-C5)-methyltransferase